MKASWQPDWLVEQRKPVFVEEDKPSIVSEGGKRQFFGNIPAIDICRLADNEGSQCDEELNLLFAASGDLRNVAKTIGSLPAEYKQPFNVVINDLDHYVVARNLIMLLVLLTSEDEQKAVDSVIHWLYSAFLRQEHLDLITSHAQPIIQPMVEKSKDKDENVLRVKQWNIGTCILRVSLKPDQWSKILRYLEVPEGLEFDRATVVRHSVTHKPERLDFVQRRILPMTGPARVCSEQFREEGILLPFRHFVGDFTVPNP
jgi:hypothetical protein